MSDFKYPRAREVSDQEVEHYRKLDPSMNESFNLKGYLESGGIVDVVALSEKDIEKTERILKDRHGKETPE